MNWKEVLGFGSQKYKHYKALEEDYSLKRLEELMMMII
jgi:hypothetical protein